MKPAMQTSETMHSTGVEAPETTIMPIPFDTPAASANAHTARTSRTKNPCGSLSMLIASSSGSVSLTSSGTQNEQNTDANGKSDTRTTEMSLGAPFTAK